MDRKNCRFYRNGYCQLQCEECYGYEANDCGKAEDFDDANPMLEDSNFGIDW